MTGNIEIYTAKDRLRAFIKVSSPLNADKLPDKSDILAALNQHKIIFGIIEENIPQVLLPENIDKTILIAEGIPAVNGKDGRLIYKFPTNIKEGVPAIDEKGKADYKNLGLIHNVTKGEALVERIPPIPGKKGKDVYGMEVGFMPGRDMALPKGKNTFCNNENTVLYAAIAGRVKIQNNLVKVEPVYELSGDVDYSSGNIDFIGDVIINGSITSGFTVKAGGSIWVKGFIEGAVVISGEDITVRGGIKTGLKGFVSAANNISARFVENSKLEAGQDIIIKEAVMQSNISAGGKVYVTGPRATIVGGIVQAGNMVEAKIIGSQLATQTVFEVGINPKLRAEYKNLTQSQKQMQKEFETINSSLKAIQKTVVHIDNLSNQKKQYLLQTLERYKTLSEEIKIGQQKLEKLRELFNQVQNSKVIAREIIYPGVNISIGTASYIVNDSIKYAQFILDDGEVRFTSV